MYLWDLPPVAVSLPSHGRACSCYWQSCHHFIGTRF
ncbi:rCG28667, isoform CRA_b [Rattus norvegicus]|uniref:RCG28667, isoform CRA_b n=1 Tax=Rattus norvegicus TaxID=10116 RepID=A6HVJ4_RAT|nr:rCG28667, isoform CRA_b [Rattus norvegicus]